MYSSGREQRKSDTTRHKDEQRPEAIRVKKASLGQNREKGLSPSQHKPSEPAPCRDAGMSPLKALPNFSVLAVVNSHAPEPGRVG